MASPLLSNRTDFAAVIEAVIEPVPEASNSAAISLTAVT